MISHLDNSSLLNLSNLSAALLCLGENMELLLAAWWMRLKLLVTNFDDLQQRALFHLHVLSNRGCQRKCTMLTKPAPAPGS